MIKEPLVVWQPKPRKKKAGEENGPPLCPYPACEKWGPGGRACGEHYQQMRDKG